jgi:3-oxoacyl-[acyl-carrier protein] reductase
MHILVTGASKGIGFAIAAKFVREMDGELCLSICSRNETEIKDAADKLSNQERRSDEKLWVYPTQCDVSKEEEVESFVSEAESRFGPIDILVNNAGFGKFAAVEDLTFEAFDSVMSTNLRGVFLVTQRSLPKMRERRAGTIVTIGSLAGKNGFVGGAAYCASKFALRGLMQSLFLEIREDNIRVITLYPGSVDTDFYSASRGGATRSTKALMAEDIAHSVFAACALPAGADISELDIRPTNPKG